MYGALLLGRYGTFTQPTRYVETGWGPTTCSPGSWTVAALPLSVRMWVATRSSASAAQGIFNQSGGTNVPTSNLFVGGDTQNLFAVSTWGAA